MEKSAFVLTRSLLKDITVSKVFVNNWLKRRNPGHDLRTSHKFLRSVVSFLLYQHSTILLSSFLFSYRFYRWVVSGVFRRGVSTCFLVGPSLTTRTTCFSPHVPPVSHDTQVSCHSSDPTRPFQSSLSSLHSVWTLDQS